MLRIVAISREGVKKIATKRHIFGLFNHPTVKTRASNAIRQVSSIFQMFSIDLIDMSESESESE